MVHIALCMSVCWSVYLESRFQLLVKRIIKIAWLLRLQLGILTVLKILIVLQTSWEGRGQGQDHYRLCCCGGGGGVNFYFHKDFNGYICIDAAAAEWHIL